MIELRLGDYIWDDFIIYVSELCRELEYVEINSTQVSDAAISHLLRRAEHLTTLDVAGCMTFSGLAFSDVTPETFKCRKLRWLQVNLGPHEQQVLKQRITQELGVAGCQVLVTQKNFKLTK